MAKKGRNMMGGRNPKRKKAVDSALEEAMGMGTKKPMKRPNATSPRPKLRPPMPTEEEIGAAERGNRAAKRRADEMPMMKAGGMMKKKGYARGGMMKKGYKAGGKLEMVKNKQGDMVPFYAADGKGKMKAGGKVKKGYAKGGMMKKGYKEGGKVDERTARMRRARADANIDQKMDADNMPTSRAMQRKKNKSKGLADMLMGGSGNMKAGGKVKKMKAGGKVRGAGIAQKGVRACKMR